ncbi:hypothetical protein ACTA57_004462 [Vibrio parahaemolyticus]|nr:hypothetical protein [Vibrio parahaemolyticus]EHH3659957.1 hypothetical protein [Vibrio parahaemolyticus]EJG1564499.1 hypothetical protein [Vibrio parahaemolyticus]
MGTLGNQDPRDHFTNGINSLDYFLEDAANLAKKHKTTLEVVVQAKHALEIERQNNIAIQHGDYIDEQAGGFGEILTRIADALESKA